MIKAKRLFTTKAIVGISLIVSITGMLIIISIGVFQLSKDASLSTDESTANGSGSADVLITDISAESSVKSVQGKDGAPNITLKATPAAVVVNAKVTLEWSTDSADVCAAFGGWSGVKNTNGSESSTELTQETSFSLTCTNSKGSTTAETKVTIDTSNQSASAEQPTSTSSSDGNSTSTGGSTGGASGGSSGGSTAVAPVLTLSIDKPSMNTGDTATISWSVNGNVSPAPACNASGSWSGSQATSGTANVSPTAGNYTFTLTCDNLAGSSTKSVSLTVNVVSSCGSGGSCTSAEVATHSSSSDCWTIVNGNVYSITSSFRTSTHTSTLGGPSLSTTKVCGKNITSIFNDKHNNGNRSGGGHNANWWLTGNGNALIGAWSGS